MIERDAQYHNPKGLGSVSSSWLAVFNTQSGAYRGEDMKMYRISNCLRTLRRRTGTQQYVLEARSRGAHLPSVRMSYIHPINFALAYIVGIAHPVIGWGVATLCLVHFLIDWRSRASETALIKIDGASHADKHVKCRSGQSCKKEKRY